MLYGKLLRFTYRLERNPVFASVKRGLLLLTPVLIVGAVALMPVSYTHLDVYKRQGLRSAMARSCIRAARVSTSQKNCWIIWKVWIGWIK